MWSYVTGVKRGHEATPLVVGNTMCVVSPLPNHLIAFDLPQPGAHVKWTYDPHVIPVAEGVACFDVINREAVYSNRKIIYNLLDTENRGRGCPYRHRGLAHEAGRHQSW